MRRMAVLRLWRSLFPPFWRRWPWLTWWRSRRTTPSTHRRRWAAHLLQQGHLKDMSLSMVLFRWLRGTNTSSAAFSLEFEPVSWCPTRSATTGRACGIKLISLAQDHLEAHWAGKVPSAVRLQLPRRADHEPRPPFFWLGFVANRRRSPTTPGAKRPIFVHRRQQTALQEQFESGPAVLGAPRTREPTNSKEDKDVEHARVDVDEGKCRLWAHTGPLTWPRSSTRRVNPLPRPSEALRQCCGQGKPVPKLQKKGKTSHMQRRSFKYQGNFMALLSSSSNLGCKSPLAHLGHLKPQETSSTMR